MCVALMSTACTTDHGGAISAAAASGRSLALDSMQPATEFAGPTEAFTPVTGKHIMILVCGNFGRACVRLGEGAKEAAEALGWTVDMIDGRLDPTVWNRAVKQAVDSGVDGIVSVSADPNLMGEAMAAVHAKKVPFVMISQSPKEGDVPGVQSWIRPDPVKGGDDIAEWIVGDSAGKASVLVLDLPDYADIMMRNDALVDRLGRDCAECTVRRVNISSQTVGTTLAPTVTSQLQQHPDLNYVWSPDDAVTNFVAQGIMQAGKSSSIRLVSFAGEPEALARVKDGIQAADMANPTDYIGWLATDSLARVMSGQPVQEVWDVPRRFFSAENIDDGGPELLESGWTVEFEYRDAFKKMWGAQ